MAVSVEISHVQKQFRKHIVLQDISLTVEKGKIFGMIGPSGCGKTTLIKVMVGMLKADQGQVTVLGELVPQFDLIEKIGYMAQSDALYTDLTGNENLQFFAKLYHLSKKQRAEKIAYAAEVVQLKDDLKRKVQDYSGGMKRRLSLAIALIQNPEILILDEPTVGIDPALKKMIWMELERLRDKEQKTIFITTHVMDEAEKCDELALMREGKILTQGTPKKLKTAFDADNFDDVFLKAGGYQA
ncbi:MULTISPECIES: ABC transporter ATP-binding protein [Rummeliibacillus]|uniref:ABC transporter ATP-binding protein n=1 Tax=Rummeliibacillus TaxID=648802 RepID=UPI0011B5A458|nr:MULTISPECIES: ABC transporter ATP-binding protein [Rummeliibacillus]MBO2535848.1 ABC transporter ATP-binding protein [Rummeliibacillus suwonensis]